MPLQD